MRNLTYYEVTTDGGDGRGQERVAHVNTLELANEIATIVGDGWGYDGGVRKCTIAIADSLDEIGHERVKNHLRDQAATADPDAYASYQALKARFG